MQKTPVYIGIFAIQPKTAAKDLRNYSKQCIQEVLGRVNSLYVNQDYNNFEQNFSFPKDNHHITTLFTGGNSKALKPNQQKALNDFKYDTKIPMKIQLCLYVPGVIVVGYSPQIGQVKCQNKYPHVTLMLSGDTKAVQSNDVIQLVINQNPNILQEEFDVKQMKTKYKGKFIYAIKKEITIQGITGDNYKYGNRK